MSNRGASVPLLFLLFFCQNLIHESGDLTTSLPPMDLHSSKKKHMKTIGITAIEVITVMLCLIEISNFLKLQTHNCQFHLID